jgi:hypothetical protein
MALKYCNAPAHYLFCSPVMCVIARTSRHRNYGGHSIPGHQAGVSYE